MMLFRATQSASRLACQRPHPGLLGSLHRGVTVAKELKGMKGMREASSVNFPPEQSKAMNQQVSWMDALDYQNNMVDKIPMGLDQVVKLDKALNLYVGKDLRTQFEAALSAAGVKTVEDLQHVKEEDLTEFGIAPVPARKFLSMFEKPAPAATPALLTPSPAAAGLYDAVDTMKGLAKKGAKSGERSTEQILASSFLGGSLLGFGCALTVTVAGGASPVLVGAPGLQQLIAGAIFPAGLSMVILSGSELLTGNFTTMALPYNTHPGKPRELITNHLARVWALSGLGNLAGSLFLAGGIYSCSVVTAGTPAAAWLCALTAKKCGLPLMTMIGKAAGANWLVNVAIFQASSAHTTAGKIASLWIPIMTFVALGLEHSIANMFLLPLGWSLGADVTLLQIVGNIGPVLVGNALGAILFVGGMQRYNLLKNMVHRSQ